MAERADKLLFTPGPLTTSRTVKQAMLHDLGSRDDEFVEIVARVRDELLSVAGVSRQRGFEAIIVQGCGTYGLEAVIGSALPPTGRLLVLANGAYGERLAKIAAVLGVAHELLRCEEDEPLDPDRVDRALADDETLSHVAMVHCETSTGLLNPVRALCRVVRARGRVGIVDSMSAFGAVPVDLEDWGVDFLISSSNKCIEGVPGFAFVLCRREALLATDGFARSLCLDLLAQWRALESNGQFRFTPPTHAILAFDRALRELEAEGGVDGRGKRYRASHRRLLAGMRTLGFREVLPEALGSPIITSFLTPEHPRFRFEELYDRLKEKGFVIYPGKVSKRDSFRIGTIGRLDESDVEALLAAIDTSLGEMGVELR